MTGYRLYRGTAAGIYGAPTTLGNVTTYTDATAVTGTTLLLRRGRRRRRRQRGREVARVLRRARSTTRIVPPAGFDGTFESGTDGASLTPAWTLSGTPQRAEYDTARAKNGTLSGWIVGPDHGSRSRRLGTRPS